MNTATEATVLPLCSLRFESADLRSPNRSLRSQRVTRTHDIFIAGNRIQFSRTEGKGFPSERVAVFSPCRLCCQRLSEFFTVSLRVPGVPRFAAGRRSLRSGSRYLVSLAFAVKGFVKLSSAAPGFGLFWRPALRRGVGGVRSGRRCMLPVGVSRQVLLSLSVVFQKTPQFQGVPIRKDSTSVQ